MQRCPGLVPLAYAFCKRPARQTQTDQGAHKYEPLHHVGLLSPALPDEIPETRGAVCPTHIPPLRAGRKELSRRSGAGQSRIARRSGVVGSFAKKKVGWSRSIPALWHALLEFKCTLTAVGEHLLAGLLLVRDGQALKSGQRMRSALNK